MTMSDRIAVMNAGRIEQIGTPTEVYDHPASAYVAGFIGQQNFFDGTVSSGDDSASPEPGVAVVTTSDGTIRSTRATGVAPGAKAIAAVRPESVAIAEGAAASQQPNAVTATLMSVSRLGSYLQVLTITATGQKVLARVPWGVPVPTTIGTVVTCSWPVDAPIVYPG